MPAMHYWFHCVCEDGFETNYDIVRESQQEAERILVRNHKEEGHGFSSLENHKIVFSAPLKSFELIKITDPHDDVSPQMWKSSGIEFPTVEDVLETQVQWCKNHFEEYKKKHNWPDSQTLENYTQSLCDSVKEDWGLDTPDSLERAERRKEWEIKYSKKYMSPQKLGARKRWAKEYARMYNEFDFAEKYDKWTLQEMLDMCGYKTYYDLDKNMVVLPCFDDDTPPLDHNDEQIEK